MTENEMNELTCLAVEQKPDLLLMKMKWNMDSFLKVAREDPHHQSLAFWEAYYVVRFGLAAKFLGRLRLKFPYALILTNDDELPALAGEPTMNLPWTFTWDSVISKVAGRGAKVIEVGRRDVSPYFDEILGLRPYPKSYVLALSQQDLSLGSAAAHLISEDADRSWQHALLGMFGIVLVSPEADYVLAYTRSAEILREIGATDSG